MSCLSRPGEHDGLLATCQPVCGELFDGASCTAKAVAKRATNKRFGNHLEDLVQHPVVERDGLEGLLTLS